MRPALKGTPQGVKPKLGRQMLERAFAAGVPCAFVVGDSVYGADFVLRRTIETSGHGYVLAVTSAQYLGFKPVVDWLEDVRRWQRLSAGEGTKGFTIGLICLIAPRPPPAGRRAS